jgi:hypothetical protein
MGYRGKAPEMTNFKKSSSIKIGSFHQSVGLNDVQLANNRHEGSQQYGYFWLLSRRR